MNVSTDNACKTSVQRLEDKLTELPPGPDITGYEKNSVTLNANEALTIRFDQLY